MNRMLSIALAAALGLAAADASAARCTSINTNTPDLKSAARVLPNKAHEVALDALGGSAKRTHNGVLENQGECLVYRFDIERIDSRQIATVIVDAGNGRVLDVIEPTTSRAIIVDPAERPVPLR